MIESYLDELAKRGLIQIFKNINDYWNRKSPVNKKLREEIIKEYPNILEGRIETLPLITQFAILEMVVKARPDLFFQNYWVGYVDFLLGKILDGKGITSEKSKIIYSNGGLFFLAAKIKSELDEDFKWMTIFNYYIEAFNSHNYVGRDLPKITGEVVKENPEEFVKFMHDRKCVSYGRHIREHLHEVTIKGGLLDKKIARRIRSDASEKTSSSGAVLLFDNIDLYPKETQQELILQFSDTRHNSVAYIMARRTPEDLLPYLVSLKDDYALNVLEKRLDAISDREDAARGLSNG